MSHAVTPERIDAAYRQLGYSIGWRFMTCPVANFANPKVLLVSLNPSGRAEHGPRWSQEAGSAYVVEDWGEQAPGRDTLQIQIQRLVQHLGVTFDEVASAHFVPFRSQRWADLAKPDEAVAFSRSLWNDFVVGMKPEYVICLGTTVGRYIPALFRSTVLVKKPTGWGEISLQIGRTAHGGQIAVLPHLGTFKLFSRAECAPYMNAALGPETLAYA